MTPPALLIAEREFKTYTTTASFWVALLIAPLLLAGGAFMAAANSKAAAPSAVLQVTRGADGAMEARFSENFPLSPAGRATIARTLAAERGEPVRAAAIASKPKADPQALSRFALVMMLWMTLTGSLGMLLQAVVRERSNRALESLLAAARPIDIVVGKLIGVGGVSALVLGAWLGATAALGAFSPASSGVISGLVHSLADPLVMARALVIYVLGFSFYGLVTVAVGARARDNAAAQNLARPMFAVLLGVFFTAMASTGGAAAKVGWLIYAPPFAPFLLLTTSHSALEEALSLALLAAAAAGAGILATRGLRLSPVRSWFKAA